MANGLEFAIPIPIPTNFDVIAMGTTSRKSKDGGQARATFTPSSTQRAGTDARLPQTVESRAPLCIGAIWWPRSPLKFQRITMRLGAGTLRLFIRSFHCRPRTYQAANRDGFLIDLVTKWAQGPSNRQQLIHDAGCDNLSELI